MAELNLKQIADRLNAEFDGEGRRLVFWYDDDGGFAEDVDALELDRAKVYRLQPDNQFYTKYFLERVDPSTNYLIYAPFPQPAPENNHLEDTLLYSRQFSTSRTALLCADLEIPAEYQSLLEDHSNLFADRDLLQWFYDLEIDTYNEETILTGLLCCVCKIRTCSFEEVVCAVLVGGRPLLEELERHDLANTFWTLCRQQFGCTDAPPSLERLAATLLVTYAAKQIPVELPMNWRPYLAYKSGSIVSLLGSMMNSVPYRECFDVLSSHTAARLKAEQLLADIPPESMVNCDAFLAVDHILIKWLTERLLAEDTGAKLNGLGIPQVCEKRIKMHFGSKTKDAYLLLENAYELVAAAGYTCPDEFREIIKQYLEVGYRLDQAYRKFYLLYGQLENTEGFEPLRELAERIYTNEYLAKQLPKWNEAIASPDSMEALPLQRNFYARYVKKADARTVVIISDAMRYEVGQELFARMQDDPKCTARLDVMLGVLPSYTQLGMAALLPHHTLEMTDQFQVLADSLPCGSLAARRTVLQRYASQSVCVQLDALKSSKVSELREICTGMQAVYVYQNQIDAHGDHSLTEGEVFTACEKAIEEIMALIRRLTLSANTIHFIVTADHGFLYQRGRRTESGKISSVKEAEVLQYRRFLISKEPVTEQGIQSLPMGRILGNADTKFVSFPMGNSVFKLPGGGQNFVHGGSSPQELLIPVLDIKMEKGHVETRPAQITLVSTVRKITTLVTTLAFLQTEPVSDTVKETAYRVFFVSGRGQRISNEAFCTADSRDPVMQNRIFHMCFTFKNQQYSGDMQYYLVVCDAASDAELFRYPVTVDLALTDE